MRRYVYIYILGYVIKSNYDIRVCLQNGGCPIWWHCSCATMMIMQQKRRCWPLQKNTSEFAVPGPCQWAAANTPSGLSQWNPVVGYIMGSGNSLKICRGQWPWRPSLQRKFRWTHYSRTIFFVHQIRGVPQIKMRVCRVRSAMRLLWIVESNDGDQLGYIINLANMPKL